MKHIITFGLVLLSFVKLTAQDFAPIGAEWHYNERHAFSGDLTFFKVSSIKDTVVDMKNCRLIQKQGNPMCSGRPDIEYMYQKDSILYFYDTTFNKFQILYDLTKKVNESWVIEVIDVMYDNNLDTIKITVDSIATKVINEKPLKELFVTYNVLTEEHPYSYKSRIIEKIGDVNYLFNYYPYSSIACDGNYADGLRCYEDSELGFYSTMIVDSCDYIYIWSNIQGKISNINIKIFPNPTSGQIKISAETKSEYLVELTDVIGRKLKSDNFTLNTQIDITAFPKGSYILLVKERNETITERIIIKN